MDLLIVILGVVLVILASYFISTAVYRRMKRGGSKAAMAVSILSFFASVFVIGVTVLYLIFSNVRLER